jgi:hypothetical protein
MKPKSAPNLENRTYRKVLALEKTLTNQIALNRVDIQAIQRVVKEMAAYFGDSRESREDNLPTLFALRLDIQKVLTQMYCYQSQMDHMDVRFDALAPIVTHCERLLREKETLRSMIYPTAEEARLRQVNAFMAKPVQGGTYVTPDWMRNNMIGAKCQWAHLHSAGVQCSVCGITPWN